MNPAPGYSAWHPRRLPDTPLKRQDSYDSNQFFSSRPATPLLGRDMADPQAPRVPQMRRVGSDSSLMQFQLAAPDAPSRPHNRSLHARARSISQRIPLPQGISLAVGICTAVAFVLSITTLAIGMANRRMLLAATEQRHDPHSPLMRMIFTVVLEAIRINAQNNATVTPLPTAILPPP